MYNLIWFRIIPLRVYPTNLASFIYQNQLEQPEIVLPIKPKRGGFGRMRISQKLPFVRVLEAANIDHS